MQLKVFINLDEPLVLPINYNHILQGIIYTAASSSNKSFTQKLHDNGTTNSSELNNKFKLFSFSKIIGKYYIQNKQIYFTDRMFFEVRSVDSYFIHLVYEGLLKNGIRFKDRIIKPDLKIEDKVITTNSVYVQTLSPIVAIKKTDDKSTCYLSPMDNDFMTYINNNFYKKYQTYYNNTPNTDLDIVVADVSYRDKCVTKFKGIYINAWNGKFYIDSEPEYLTFIYNVGLGSRNSQGFGLLNIIDE